MAKEETAGTDRSRNDVIEGTVFEYAVPFFYVNVVLETFLSRICIYSVMMKIRFERGFAFLFPLYLCHHLSDLLTIILKNKP